jgi:hypothetical protein
MQSEGALMEKRIRDRAELHTAKFRNTGKQYIPQQEVKAVAPQAGK